ncbi:MAG: serine/threonine protein phosphatase [Clostridiales bacterium]|nr:serine/threonine protein phosphatase [Clostridiales bacterium]
MSLFVLSDTHLSISDNKPMDIFGSRWLGYTDRLKENWNRLVSSSDTVVIAGDISWAMSHTGAVEDLRFIENLNGNKIIGRGNHDYWWTSIKKLTDLCEQNGFHTLQFLYNNAFEVEDFIIAGSRGWYIDESNRKMPQNANYQKIVAREAIRLELSLSEAVKLQNKILNETGIKKEILAFLHFPPDFRGYVCSEIVAVLERFDIHRCYFGHIHGVYDIPRRTVSKGIAYTLTSADFLNFTPLIIAPEYDL